jgi:hypothetical protein
MERTRMKWTTAFGLILVLIANIGKCEEVSPAVQKYEREAFGAWIDQDDDCQNTRHELLISRSIKETKLRPDNCLVKSGQWFDPYSGDHIFAAIELDIDHLVPLKFAWVHGAFMQYAEQVDIKEQAAKLNLTALQVALLKLALLVEGVNRSAERFVRRMSPS